MAVARRDDRGVLIGSRAGCGAGRLAPRRRVAGTASPEGDAASTNLSLYEQRSPNVHPSARARDDRGHEPDAILLVPDPRVRGFSIGRLPSEATADRLAGAGGRGAQARTGRREDVSEISASSARSARIRATGRARRGRKKGKIRASWLDRREALGLSCGTGQAEPGDAIGRKRLRGSQ